MTIAISAPYNLATHNGIITMRNPATGNHRTIKIATQKKDARFAPGKRIVYLLTGSNNTSDYQGFGFIKMAKDGQAYIAVWKKQSTDTFRQLGLMIQHPVHYIETANIEYLFEGCCRVCNKTLTTPESIKSGIGPVCGGR